MASTFSKSSLRTDYKQLVKRLFGFENDRTSKCGLLKVNTSSYSSVARDDEQFVVKSSFKSITIPTTSIYDIIWRPGIEKHGNKAALVRW